MRVSGKRQGIDKWSNGWSCSTDFLRRKSKCKIKWKEVNKDNSLTHFTFSILFVIYKREEVEIRHEPYWYDKEQLPYLTSTQLVLFDGSLSNMLVDHLWQASWKNTTFGFQEIKKEILMFKMVNMTLTINQKILPSSINKKEGSALV